jgi:hypothetical protein
MSRVDRKSGQRLMRKPGLSAALVALLAGAMVAGTGGCAALPALSVIPSVISLGHEMSTTKSEENGADTKNQDAELAADKPSSPPSKLTPGNVCQMIAIARPNLVVVELRRGAAGALEYRELRLLNSTDDARWTPVVDGNTGPEGWRPAVNFLKMDFKPPLTDVIPDNGPSYLAYAPTGIDSNNLNRAAGPRSASGVATGTFSWDGRVYQYTVARTLPCLSPPS